MKQIHGKLKHKMKKKKFVQFSKGLYSKVQNTSTTWITILVNIKRIFCKIIQKRLLYIMCYSYTEILLYKNVLSVFIRYVKSTIKCINAVRA